MERDAALDALPAPYGSALTLRAEGHDEAAIAERVGVPADAIAALLEVGEAKLAVLLAAPDPSGPPGSELGV